MKKTPISWAGIVRLGLVQTSLGAIVVMTTSTLNRIMVVELALPAMLPGFLVAIHYYVQILRPRFGHGSDTGRARTPWIIGGMAVLGAGGVMAAAATALMATSTTAGIVLATIAFILIGAGVGASGTCLLVLLAATVDDRRRAAAASITWIMMIAGFAVTAGIIGAFLDPFSFQRLIVISAIVSSIALITTVLALGSIERRHAGFASKPEPRVAAHDFKSAIRDVMSESHTRRFAAFVFISMLAYSAQDLVLEPFAGAVFGMSPGESTQLGGTQHGGVLLGMMLVAFIGYRLGDGRHSILRKCMIAGCLASSLLLLVLAGSGYVSSDWPLHTNVGLLGIANGVFAVAAIGSMMGLVSKGHRQRDGVRMGVWGAAQAIAFGLGGMIGTLSVDVVRWLTDSALYAYSLVFLAQAALFASAAFLAAELSRQPALASNKAIGAEA
ncbi:MAG: BCD family MFS transporter [Woeseiaceae bacterium]|nr:BCD family MFS transporter [Woeseiaceae bacterium]